MAVLAPHAQETAKIVPARVSAQVAEKVLQSLTMAPVEDAHDHALHVQQQIS